MKPGILIVDDEQSILFVYSRYLEKAGYSTVGVGSMEEARDAINTRRFDAVILDLFLPDGKGIDWIGELRNAFPDIAIVVVTGAGDINVAVDAMRRGADNFLTKPVNMDELDVFLQKSLEVSTLRRGSLTSQRLKKKKLPYFGESQKMKNVHELALLAAENDSPVLLQGETGSGKGVLADWIQNNSADSSSPFVEVNCSALRGELLASELFGHVKGAFTSAVQNQQGLIELADGGTLFLDEISDMDISVQAQFLKVIEEKCYRRVGEVKLRHSSFRLICATNRDLAAETGHGRFRRDLYYRINVFPIDIPPLRDRLEDLPGLIRHLLGALGSPEVEVSAGVLEAFMAYPWPGNIREINNLLERAVLLSRGGPLEMKHFPGLEFGRSPAMPEAKEPHALRQVEEEYIRSHLSNSGGDVRKLAKKLGVSRSTLYRKLKRFRESQD
jgi:DNA-binding NtrC family response regulator